MPRGQASLEYVGVLALVAVVLGAAVVVTDAPDLARAVGTQIRRALCIVANGDCLSPRGPVPCITGATEDRRETSGEVVVLRLADGRVVLREQRSDGSVAVTVAQSDAVGAGLTFGGDLKLGRVDVAASGEVQGQVRGGYTRRFVRSDGASADRLIAELAERDWPFGGVGRELARLATGGAEDGPVPDEREYALGHEISGEAALDALGLVGAEADGLGARTIGVRVSPGTGERTVVLRVDAEFGSALNLLAAGLDAGAAGSTQAALTFDRDRHPVRLLLSQFGGVRGSAHLDSLESGGGDRVEVEQRLELADPTARADALAALRGDPSAATRTARRFAADARTDVRVYGTSREESSTGGRLGFGVSAGFEQVRSLERRHLVRAYAREGGQGWGPNLECQLAA